VLSELAIGLLSFAAGILLTAACARWIIVRHLRKVRSAERRARASERLAEIGAMTGGLAHEIKNPLSTIGLNAQLLAEAIEELPLDQEQKGRVTRRIGSLRREVERLRGILTDFLRYAGNIKLEKHPADVNEVVRDLIDFFLPQAESQGVRLRDNLTNEPLMAEIDVAQVKQALLNLMLNAVQAMATKPSDSTLPRELILRTERTPGDGPHSEVRLHVIDTGPGIPADAIERIFQPYYTTKAGGSGLGLPTARRLIEAHDGRLEVHSEPGKGTDFSIVLPGCDREPGPITPPTPLRAPRPI
jgi:signal transduction histidine kinase